jgi:hypothetical protein
VLLHGGQSHHRTRRFIADPGSHGAAADFAPMPETFWQSPGSTPVFEIPGRIVRRIDSVAAGLGDIEIDVLPDAIAIARLVERIHAQEGHAKRIEFLIGLRSAGTDYTLVYGPFPEYHQSRFEKETGDVVYFAVRSLELALVDLRDVARVSLYGTNANESAREALARVFGSGVGAMDPVAMLDLDSDRFETGFPFEAFAVCLGAAL